MKLKCDKENIKKGFHIVESIASTSNIKPILQNVKVTAADGKIELFTTDLEISINHTINTVDIIEPGVFVCSISKIASIIKEWTDKDVEISESNGVCNITGNKEYFKIQCADPLEFPTVPQFSEEGFIEIDRALLADMARKTSFIMLGDKTEHSTSGIFLDIAENKLKMVANDGRRLSEVKQKIDNQTEVKSRCIIPIKGISQILRILDGHDEVVKIKVEEKRILVKTSNTTLCSQLIEGLYPEYEEVIPTDLDKKINLDRESFTTAVRRCAIMTTEEYKLLKFKIHNELMEISCKSPDVGESKVEIPVEYKGEDTEIGLNPDFIVDFMKVAGADRVELNLRNPDTAAVFKVGNNSIYVVMPIDLER